MRPCSAFALTEVLVALAILSLLGTVTFAYLSGSRRVAQRIDDAGQARRALARGVRALQGDLRDSGGQVAAVSNGHGENRSGDAIWFLSAFDPNTGSFIRLPGGSPHWQKNVLYYLAVPTDHDSRFGIVCQGWDRVCPHKVLIRKVIDSGAPTSPSSPEDDAEPLLSSADIGTYLTRPTGSNLSTMSGEPGLVSAEMVTEPLLDLEAHLESRNGRVISVVCDLEAVRLGELRGNFPLGTLPIPANTYSTTRRVGVVPGNP